jgi:hypothetical protein
MFPRHLVPILAVLLAAAAPEAPPPAPSRSAAPEMPPTVAIQRVPPNEAMPVLGHTVAGPDGKVIARLVNVLVDAKGQPVAAVLDFGGFMGVGTRVIAVHWNTLRFVPSDPAHPIVLTMTPDEIKAAPEYTETNKPAQVVVPAGPASKPVAQ